MRNHSKVNSDCFHMTNFYNEKTTRSVHKTRAPAKKADDINIRRNLKGKYPKPTDEQKEKVMPQSSPVCIAIPQSHKLLKNASPVPVKFTS